MLEQALCELVCDQEYWSHTRGKEFRLKFNRDGTGEVLAAGGPGWGYVLIPSMKWKVLPCSKSAAEIMNDKLFKHTNLLTKQPELLGCLRLEIELNSRVAESFRSEDHKWPTRNDMMFTDVAYVTRQFTVVIEKGSFAAVRGDPVRHGLRMTFDNSPYPTAEGFRTDDPSYDDGRVHVRDWTWICDMLNSQRAYYAGKPTEESSTGRATDDDTLFGYNTSNCVMS